MRDTSANDERLYDGVVRILICGDEIDGDQLIGEHLVIESELYWGGR